MISPQDIPGLRYQAQSHQAAVAMGAGDTQSIFLAPFACIITAVTFLPDGAMTGDATDTKIVALRNEGTDGTGTTAVAAADTFGAGDSLAEQTPRAFTLSTTTANVTMADGELLSAVITEAGNGIAWPTGTWVVEYRHLTGS